MRKLGFMVPVVAAVVVLAMGPAPGAPSGLTREELGRGTAAADYQVGGGAGTEVVVMRVTIEPGGASGWHTHPGPETAIVKAGTLTFFDSQDPECAAQTFSAGQAVVGTGQAHMARNLGDVPVELLVSYYDVAAGGATAAPAEEPAHCAGR